MKSKTRLAYGFILPALLSILFFTLLPVAYTIMLSFTNYNMYHLDSFSLIGMKNYITVFSGSIGSAFFSVLSWTVIFAALSTAGSYLVGMVLAVLLNNPNMHESKLYKTILIIPWALPATIAILSWQGLLNEQYGGINMMLRLLHLSSGIPWLTSAFWARTAIIMVNIWLGYPFMLNVCLGGLQSISPVYYEAAKIDGASKWQCFRTITFPLLIRVSIPLIVSTFASNFNNFGNIYMITQGGPAKEGSQFAGSTDILASTIYKMTTWSNRFDLSATLSVITFLIVGILTLININFSGAFGGDE